MAKWRIDWCNVAIAITLCVAVASFIILIAKVVSDLQGVL